MSNKILWGIAILGVMLGFAGLIGGNSSSNQFGASGTRFPNGIYAGTSSQFAVTSGGDVTVGGGTLNVTTSNTATSTVVAGCFQFYATSTATALNFQASTTPGVMYSSYGSCPNL